MSEMIEALLKNFRDVKINNKSKRMMSAKTRGVLIGRGIPSKVDFFIKSDNKICIDNDSNILLRPKIKYICSGSRFIPMIKCYIKREDNIIKGWVYLNNIFIDQHSRL